MKKVILFLVLIAIPLVILARPERMEGSMRARQMMSLNNRAYRLTALTSYYYYDDTWNMSGVYEYFYNPYHPARIDSTRYRWWDDWNQTWVVEGTERFEYNAVGKLISAKFYYFDGEGFILEWIAEFVYDDQNRLIHEYDKGFDDYGTLMDEYRNHYFWGPVSCTAYGYYYSSWDREMGYNKMTSSFDNQGRIEEAIYSESPDSLSWVPMEKTAWSYHPHDTSNFTTFVNWVSEAYLNWLGLGDYLGFGNGDMMVTQEVSYEWLGRDWDMYWREAYTWDEATDQLVETSSEEYWDGVWHPSSKYEYTYDANQNPVEVLYLYWEDQMQQYVISGKNVATWEYATAVDDPTAPPAQTINLKVWPQPFATDLCILPESQKGGQINIGIYNLKGQLIATMQTSSGNSVHWDGKDNSGATCGSGVYFIRASQDGGYKTVRAIRIR